MAGTVLFEEQFEMPLNLHSLESFRQWTTSDAFPDRGRIDYVGGRIEVDMSPEDLHCHGKVKTELIIVVGRRVREAGLGELYTDRARVSCPEAGLSAEPDILFVTEESIDSARVRFVPRASAEPDRFIEMEGAPDLIVEIVSDHTVKKDTERLPQAYFRAGVVEFWLVDARHEDLFFQIFRRGESEFEEAESDEAGFQCSTVFHCRYRLRRGRNARGRLTFTLGEKPWK